MLQGGLVFTLDLIFLDFNARGSDGEQFWLQIDTAEHFPPLTNLVLATSANVNENLWTRQRCIKYSARAVIKPGKASSVQLSFRALG